MSALKGKMVAALEVQVYESGKKGQPLAQYHTNTVYVIELKGTLRDVTSPVLIEETAMLSALKPLWHQIIFDVSQVINMSTGGLGGLLQLYHKSDKTAEKARLAGANEKILTVLSTTKLKTELFDTYATLEDAIASYQR
ncbi:STAS domain-containing protein [Candidatus Woesearchaeota archaeon]|nr:MAG: STAS domain-containing protein [Candidatus Woesearchaeota archaeon]